MSKVHEPGTIQEALKARTEKWPDRPALIWESEILTWADLFSEAEGLATALLDSDITPGAKVATWGSSAPLHVVSLLACGFIESLHVPFNPRWPAPFLQDQLSGIALVITDGRLPALHPTRGIRTLSWRLGAHTASLSERPFSSEVAPHTPVTVDFSRGSPGSAPRGCLLTHRMILANALATAKAMELQRGERVAFLLPGWQHPHELIGKGLATGTVGLVLDFPYPRAALSALNVHHPNWVVTSPRVMDGLLPFGDRMKSAFRSTKKLLLVGDYPCPNLVSEVISIAGVEVFNGWASAETSGVALLGKIDPKASDRIGFPCPGYEASIKSATGSKEGELLLRGEGVALSYADKTPVTGTEGWFATGDIVRLAKDNGLRLLGRPGEAWLRAGRRVPLRHIESSLSRVPGVRETAALLGEEGSGEVSIYIEAGESPLSMSALARRLSQLFGTMEQPDVKLLPALPRQTDGRIDKAVLARGADTELDIEALDRAILALINRRATFASRRSKTETSPLSVDEAIITRVIGHNAGPLYDDSVEEIFRCILDHCKRTR